VTPLAAAEQAVAGAVETLGPVLGTVVVLTAGVGVGAVLGTVVGVGYLRWSGSSSGGESSAGAEPPASATAPADDGLDGPSTDGDGLVPDVPTEMPRRQVLGTVAAAGGAAALGGLGTSAFYTDQERFGNSQVVTGELDLKVDWQEHYSDWSDDETEGLTVDMDDETVGPGFPSAAGEKLVYVSDADQFLENTAVEAFPDGDNNALRDGLDDDSDICDLDADVEDALMSDLRTEGTFPEGVAEDDRVNPQTTGPGDRLVDIEDVKPGDFGEVTFSFHLCGNPGYVWLTGALRSNLENEVIGPEEGAADEGSGGELADAIRAAVWYDTGVDGSYGADLVDKDDDGSEGDNFRQTEERLLLRGSLREVLDAVADGPGLPLDADPGANGASGEGTGETAPTVGGTVGTGAANVDEVFDTRKDDRFDGAARNYDCDDYEERIEGVDDLDGEAREEAALFDGAQFSPCPGVTVTVESIDGGSLTLSSDGAVRVVSVKGGSQGEQVYVFTEPVVLNGAEFSTPGGGVSNVDVCCPADGGNGGGGGQGDLGRQCLPNSTTAYVGFEWWVPREVGSEIQTDSVSFDLGFYTEQCRHNDGSGFGTPGGGPGNGDDDDNGDDTPGGDGDISFLAACVDADRAGDFSQDEVNFQITDATDPSAVGWAADVGVDSVVAYFGGQFTTYVFEEPQTSGTAVAGEDDDSSFAEESPTAASVDPGVETTTLRPKEDQTEATQTQSEPCPPGYDEVVKFEYDEESGEFVEEEE
jgi:predicted ribosomally synthesized peptide with SipW-like signal peptide